MGCPGYWYMMLQYDMHQVPLGSVHSIVWCIALMNQYQILESPQLPPNLFIERRLIYLNEKFDPCDHPSGNIPMFYGASMFRTLTWAKLTIFIASLNDINPGFLWKDLKIRPIEEIVPEQYHEFFPLFNQVWSDRWPPHRLCIVHAECLTDEETPTCGPLYSMSSAQLVILKEWLEENMSKGCIRQAASPFTVPDLFAKWPEEGLQFCIDYWDINNKTIQNQYPHSLIKETLNLVRKARILGKLDVRWVYNLLRVPEGNELKSAIGTRYGSFEPIVMQFGTTNALAAFQLNINTAIREALNSFASAYLQDALIYIES